MKKKKKHFSNIRRISISTLRKHNRILHKFKVSDLNDTWCRDEDMAIGAVAKSAGREGAILYDDFFFFYKNRFLVMKNAVYNFALEN